MPELAVNCKLSLAQKVEGPFKVTTASAVSTTIVRLSEHETPLTVVVTVYVVVCVGETVIVGVVSPPGDQE